MSDHVYAPGLLDPRIRSRMVAGVNGLDMHILEAGHEEPGRPLVLLLHGFPELAFSWRKLLAPLAAAGYHAVAPDLRGYGRTLGGDPTYDGDLYSYRRLNNVRDVMGLLSALGRTSVACVVGHDFGSPVAAWCAVARPDIFRSVVLMSAPFGGTSPFPYTAAGANRAGQSLDDGFAALDPPRKHYQRYYTTREAGPEMSDPGQGVHAFLRGYYHVKSADWAENRPYRLPDFSAESLGAMPEYYIMRRDRSMSETAAAFMPSAAEIAANNWLSEPEMAVYAEEFGRTGFQGGLNWYRAGALGVPEMELYAGRRIEQPSMFVAGASDWGVYQSPGALEAMRDSACTDMRGVHLVPGAGHWVQQEQPGATMDLLLEFLRGL